MSTTERLAETLRDLLSASNPGLVTKDEVLELERQLEELMELADAIEARLERPVR